MRRVRGFLGAIQHFIRGGSRASRNNDADNTPKSRKDEHGLDKHEEAEIEEAANASIDAASEITSTTQDGACPSSLPGITSSLPRISTTSQKQLVSLENNGKTPPLKKNGDETTTPIGSLGIDESLKQTEKLITEIRWKEEVPLVKEKIPECISHPTSDPGVCLPRIGNGNEYVGASPVGKEPNQKPTIMVGGLQQGSGLSEGEDKRLVLPGLNGNASRITVPADPVASSNVKNVESLPSTQGAKKKKKKKTKRTKHNKIKPLDHLPSIQSPESGLLAVAMKDSTVFDASNPPKVDKIEEDGLEAASTKSGCQELRDLQPRKQKSRHKLPQIKRWLHRKNNLVAPLPDLEMHLAATGSSGDGSCDLRLADHQAPPQSEKTCELMPSNRSIETIIEGRSRPLKLPPGPGTAQELDAPSNARPPENPRMSCDLLRIPPLKLTPGCRTQLVSDVHTLPTPRSLYGKSAHNAGPVNAIKQKSKTHCVTDVKLCLPKTKLDDTTREKSPRTQSMVVDLPCGVQFVPAPIIKSRLSKTQKDNSVSNGVAAISSRSSVQCLPQIQSDPAVLRHSRTTCLVRLEDSNGVNVDTTVQKEGKQSTTGKLPLVGVGNERPLTAKRPPYPEHWGDIPTKRPPGRGGHGFFLGIMRDPNTKDPLFNSSSSEDISEDDGFQLCAKVIKPAKERLDKDSSNRCFPSHHEATQVNLPRHQEQPGCSREGMWCQWNAVPTMGKVRVSHQAKNGPSFSGANATPKKVEDMAITDFEDVQGTRYLA